jgi:hypothetical protein
VRLLTNDDGIHSPGLHALARYLHRAGHEIVIAVAESGRDGLQFEFRATDAHLDPDSDTALVGAGFVTLTALQGVSELAVTDRELPGIDPAQVIRELRDVPSAPGDSPAVDRDLALAGAWVAFRPWNECCPRPR